MTGRRLVAYLAVSAVLGLAVVGHVRAADEWFVLGEQALKASDPSVEIKSQGNRWKKDVKQVRLSVDGADVEISKVVLRWNNRPDDTITGVGLVKAGGQTAPKDAPGRKAQLTAVVIQYKLQGGATGANVKVWGFD